MKNSDPQLLRRLKVNDRAAFEEVVERHYQPVYRQLWHVCGEVETAADLTQETFVQAWKSLPSFEGRSALGTWLHTIAARVWMRWKNSANGHEPAPLDELSETLVDPGLSPAELLDARIEREEI